MTWLAGAVILLVIALLVMAFLNVFFFSRRRGATFTGTTIVYGDGFAHDSPRQRAEKARALVREGLEK